MSRGIKWTKREETYVIGWKSAIKNEDFQKLADDMYEAFGNRRSAHAVKMKWKKLQETHAIAEETETQIYSSGWDDKQDFFLLVNFYDMSIDEVREYFGRSYADCAGRLEQLIDSTELTHIELVKKAAMTVRERREPYVPKIPSSRKEKRLIAKMNKLNDKLMRLRGGEE
tara:strand:+ start:11020 stop:11529 length:510 start_codon:yes stop_codon:yes gene_type:complete